MKVKFLIPLFIILVLCKCILIEWDNILIGKYTKNSTLKPFKCAENILSESITNKSGGKSDLTLSFKDKFIVFSCKMWDKFSPGESDVERINNTILSRKEETSIGFICKNKSDVTNHNIQDEDTNDIFKKIIENKLSVRQAENFVQLFRKKRQKSKITKDTNIIALELSISNKIGLNVDIQNNKRNKGKISFEYKDLDQLNKIIDIIKSNY